MVCLIRKSIRPKLRENNNPKTVIVVTGRRIIVVTVRDTAVARIVVPTAAAQHTVQTCCDHQLYIFAHNLRSKPLVYAF